MRPNPCLFALLSALLLIAASSQDARATGEECRIADPNDTSLNVRDAPSGKIINRLRNGRKVVVQEVGYDARGRAWANVSGDYKGTWRDWGWVYKLYLECSGTYDQVPVQTQGYPLVFTRAADVRLLGLVLANYGPDYDTVRRFANRCHYYGDGGNDISVSDSLLRHYRKKGFSLNSLCMALVSGIRFHPETGARLPTYIVVDEKSLRQMGFAEAGVISEELPLDVPTCFSRGLPYTDCAFNYHPRTGVRLGADTTAWYKRTGDTIIAAVRRELSSGRFASECTCAEFEANNDECRIEKHGACKDSEFIAGDLAVEYVAFSAPQEAWIGFYDVSTSLPLGFGYALYADGAAGPSSVAGSDQLALSGKNRATKAKIQEVLNARAQN